MRIYRHLSGLISYHWLIYLNIPGIQYCTSYWMRSSVWISHRHWWMPCSIYCIWNRIKNVYTPNILLNLKYLSWETCSRRKTIHNSSLDGETTDRIITFLDGLIFDTCSVPSHIGGSLSRPSYIDQRISSEKLCKSRWILWRRLIQSLLSAPAVPGRPLHRSIIHITFQWLTTLTRRDITDCSHSLTAMVVKTD